MVVMRQKNSINPIFKRVMEATGFYRQGKPSPGVLDAGTLIKSKKFSEQNLKYGTVLNADNMGADAIFELSGSACIYFKSINGQTPFPDEMARIHRTAWNHGLAPMMWVVTTTEVMILSCYSRPERKDQLGALRHVIATFPTTDKGLKELNEFSGRVQVETGKVWLQDKMTKINRERRVDRCLLQDLTDVQAKLSHAGLVPHVARSVLGRSILAAWLSDRKILNKEFFQANCGVDSLIELLGDKDATYKLFAWLDDKFNHNVFPLKFTYMGKTYDEKKLVQPEHLEIIQKMFDGRRIKRNLKQQWIYDFSIMPVEYISSIYEMFTATGSSKLGPVRSTQYTPMNLVEMVVSKAFEVNKADGNVLDMSCGSGVFLVEAFRRLLGRKVAKGEALTRKLVRKTLHEQLYGLDVNFDALQIAAFCLYLTALELDPDPQSLDAMDFEPLIGKTLIAADAFDIFAPFNVQEPFKSRNFVAVVGNPPWTRCKDKGLAWDYCRQLKYPLARSDTPDQAFLWRMSRFAGEKTAIGLILHASPFFSHAKPALKAKAALWTRFTTKRVINLCELRQDGLFPNSTAPALIYIAQGRRPEDEDTCLVSRCDRADNFKRHGIIELHDDYRKEVSVVELAEDPDLLKAASWAGYGDLALIQRLRKNFIRLDKFCDRLRCRKGLNRGQGFQLTNGNKEVPELIGLPYLKSGSLGSFNIDAKKLPKLPKMSFYSPRNPGIYWGPLVITVRGLSYDGFKAAYCDHNVVYTEEYYGFSFAASDDRYAHYLNAILNSRLASYYLFLTGSVWGIERDKIEPNDLMNLPIPAFEPGRKSAIDKMLDVEAAILQELKTADKPSEKLLKKLDQAVFDLYGLSETERAMVLDTVNHTLDLKIFRDNSQAITKPASEELVTYVEHFTSAMGVGDSSSGTVFDVPGSPLQIVRINLKKSSDVAVESKKDLYSLLDEIATDLPSSQAGGLFPLNFKKIDTGSDIYILKPSQRRHWTVAAAQNDAQRFMMDRGEKSQN
jgi:hypothetical protein